MSARTVCLQVAFYGPLRPIAGAHLLNFRVTAPATLEKLLSTVLEQLPALRPELTDTFDRPLPYIHLFVNGRDHPHLPDRLETRLHANDRVDIFPATAGGADVIHPLRALIVEESAALEAYRSLGQEITDPTASIVLAALAREAQQDCAMLRRMQAGALETCERATACAINVKKVSAEIDVLLRKASEAEQNFRELACSERGCDHGSLAILLEAMATNSEKHVRLLAELERYLTSP